jgi:hypothetical protein
MVELNYARRRVIEALCGAVFSALPARAGTAPTRVGGARPVLNDIERFLEAHESMRRGRSAFGAAAHYVDGATPGLRAYLAAYQVTARDFVAAFQARPNFYAGLAEIGERVAAYDNEIARVEQELRTLAPRTPSVPVFCFIGVMRYGATVKEVTTDGGENSLGVLVPVELLAMTSATDMTEFPEGRRGRGELSDLPQMVCHELAHVAQIRLQGLEVYRSLYRDRSRGNHLGYAIREGGADYLAYLATGKLRERHQYLAEHERALWRAFEPLLYQPAANSQGWFSGFDTQHPERPAQLGYAIGWSICRQFHAESTDPDQALATLLSAVDADDFERIMEPYRKRMLNA